jgi:cobalt-zinc-cadmium efflux system membrane fusion protein
MKRVAANALTVVVLLVAAGLAFQFFGKNAEKSASDSPQKEGTEHREEGRNEDGVKLSDAKVGAAGIVLEKAGPETLRDSLLINGILQPNQEALVQVTPRFAGVIREVNKRVGDRVEKNELLGKIESNQSLTTYEVRAPIAGTIIERQAALGEFVSEQKPIFIIADLSKVWADFAVYGRDLRRVHVGDAVVINLDDGGPTIETKISYVAPVGSADTQSALARAVVDNSDRRLRPGLFITGRLQLAAKPVKIAIKSAALQTHENRTVVFVRSGEKFEVRDVEIGARDPEHVEVLRGVEDGDVYAGKNSFVIKAELAKGEAAHEH